MKEQEQLRRVKTQIYEALVALRKTQIVKDYNGGRSEFVYLDRYFAVAEQHLNLALLALAEGREQMREL